MVYDLNRKRIFEYSPYFDIKEESGRLRFPSSELNNIERLRKLIDKSVRDRMIADVPVGAFLSGGLDSSTIVHYASKYTDKLNTFSIQFDYEDYDESKWANIISDKYKTNHHVIKFNANDVKKVLEELPNYFDDLLLIILLFQLI